jgi:RNA polymerase sigma-70 factor (ECF subfamily)
MLESEWSTGEDWDLAEAAGRGDESAFAELTSRHQDPVHRFIFRSVGQEETARDLTQEVFVRAWFALPKLDRKAQFTTWLFRIAVNICRDHAKSKAARQERNTFSLEKDSRDETAVERQLVHPDPSPDKLLEQSEAARLLDEEIRRLPNELLQPFLLGAVEGYPYKEIAVMLGLSPKAVEVRVYRARRLLMERLGNSGLTHSG